MELLVSRTRPPLHTGWEQVCCTVNLQLTCGCLTLILILTLRCCVHENPGGTTEKHNASGLQLTWRHNDLSEPTLDLQDPGSRIQDPGCGLDLCHTEVEGGLWTLFHLVESCWRTIQSQTRSSSSFSAYRREC